ncbi:flagellar biosynthesis protein FlhA [Reinekea blandensis]|uniref:Flagellar biosynthesis protein FlhA n=1 Tax=Reinekea blandensis MED297 TaxID=314283 RepID=A4BEH5_9GAMM|nr:flagellar biosynthesis protein FlhA [Reinekea blandensis]EAR09402.1 Flagellar biosynthesis pathway, component FlhA [Reinekea sp. MED297] [Reinekea blandensis MED297]
MALFDNVRSAGQQIRNVDGQAVLRNTGAGARVAGQRLLGVPLMLLMLLGLMTLPVPTFVLDTFFTFNIALAIVVLLVTIYVLRPLDFAVFPSILLVATLLRLSLNVASTRVVLMYGHEGGDAAGKVIEAFGEVLIGGNYAVGLVVFAILMIINFVVVTKGAGRVSEVSARFTLDAMPGKQMAIDADLNAGLIDADTAKLRRSEIAQEADFYGSMDGASKFVRGDAVAGILILLINIVGGLLIGMMQHDLEFGDAVQKYALLTIGDGLVAQIPGLLLSVAAAIMVTRNSSSEEIGDQVIHQMFATPRALGITGFVLFAMGILPGMPHLVFLGLALICALVALWIHMRAKQETGEPILPMKSGALPKTGGAGGGKLDGPPPVVESPADTKELSWDDVQPVDIIGLEVGYRLIPLVDRSQGGQVLGRIKGIRKKLSQELGFLVPSIHIRDNLDLMPNVYQLTLMGVAVADGEVYPDRELAINPGQVFGPLDGVKTVDPAFGLEATWIAATEKDKAQTLGYTVVDASTVVATHVNHVLSQHAYELLGHEEVQQMVDLLAKHSPKLAEELVPNSLSLSQLLKVLQNLLIEEVPIRDMRTIAESITNHQPKTQDIGVLTNAARMGLSRLIIQSIIGNEKEIPVVTLDRGLEQLLHKTVQQAGADGNLDSVALEPGMADRLQNSLQEMVQKLDSEGKPAILLVAAPLRMLLARFVRHGVPNLKVLSFQEIPDNKHITIVATVGGQ